MGTKSPVRSLYGQFRATVGHKPGGARASETVQLLHSERPAPPISGSGLTVSDFPVRRRSLTEDGSSTPARRLTISLLRPVGGPEVLLLTQVPANAGG
ncbi:hypothetical protein [Streptomyces rimosus]|uniref:hypothetical protein n=1 Tax=Streptomyces rimosus TaxID=1927 RepID=UPI000AD8A945|nr:hypothetical protein [Streptomyces rimosus]